MKTIYFITLFLSIALYSCGDTEEPKKAGNEILSFVLTDQVAEATIDTENATVEVIVDSMTNLAGLTPEITISEGAQINPVSGEEVDFSAGTVKYTVTSEKGIDREWNANVAHEKSGEAELLSFTFRGIVGKSVIDDTNIAAVAKLNVNLEALKPTINISPEATISPNSGEPVDFANGPVVYTVTAANGTQKAWFVEVNYEKVYSADILTFTVPNQVGETVFEGTGIYVEVPSGYDFTNVVPSITSSEGTTVAPESGVSVDFSQTGYIDYVVTTEINTQKTWRVYLQEETIKPSNAHIQYMGRFDRSNPLKPKFWAPGTAITLKFRGTYCEVLLNDQQLWSGYNYIELIVDDNEPIRVRTDKKINEIDAIKNLADGEHTLMIVKDTEADMGYLEFIGIRCEELLEPDPLPERKIECIGNSITCGFGIVDSEVACGTGLWYDQHSAYFAYGPTAARELNAQWMLSSVSGIGLIHSCCNKEDVITDVYYNTNLKSSGTPWDFTIYRPDVVTICLGQNDGIQDSTAFSSAYVRLIESLQSKHPEVQVVCMTSPMADENLKNFQIKCINGVVNHFGNNKVHKLFLEHNKVNGCDFHPNKAEQQGTANEIVGFFKDTFGW